MARLWKKRDCRNERSGSGYLMDDMAQVGWRDCPSVTNRRLRGAPSAAEAGPERPRMRFRRHPFQQSSRGASATPPSKVIQKCAHFYATTVSSIRAGPARFARAPERVRRRKSPRTCRGLVHEGPVCGHRNERIWPKSIDSFLKSHICLVWDVEVRASLSVEAKTGGEGNSSNGRC